MIGILALLVWFFAGQAFISWWQSQQWRLMEVETVLSRNSASGSDPYPWTFEETHVREEHVYQGEDFGGRFLRALWDPEMGVVLHALWVFALLLVLPCCVPYLVVHLLRLTTEKVSEALLAIEGWLHPMGKEGQR